MDWITALENMSDWYLIGTFDTAVMPHHDLTSQAVFSQLPEVSPAVIQPHPGLV